MITQLLGVASLLVIAAGVLYFCTMMLLGVREGRSVSSVIDGHRAPRIVAVFIPCLNEALVIGDTVRALRNQALAAGTTMLVMVIDDGSDDGTAAEVLAADPHAQVLRRDLPFARQGKGAALNHAFDVLTARITQDGTDPTDVVVCVLDADGRLSEGAIIAAIDALGDPAIGGVQLPVRIRNRVGLLTQLQDLEFWGFSATTQIARRRTGTVSLGGNGQFTRLAALQSLGTTPWSKALTEDLDLALSLATRGWRLTTVTGAYVDQQGITTISALLRQRTRWFQGHMTCARRIPELLRCPKISNSGAVEMTAYLLVPFILTLPWSVLGQWALAMSVLRLFHGVSGDLLGTGLVARAAFGVAWYVVGFFPTITLAAIYRRRAGCTRRHAFVLGHALLAYNYLMYIAAWMAVYRMVRNRDGWTKTTRTLEQPSFSPVST